MNDPFLVFLIFIAGCSTAPSERQIAEFNSAVLSAQGACYAAEMAEAPTKEMKRACIKEKYHLCRVYTAQNGIIWYGSGWGFKKDKKGYPRTINEMKHEMAVNRCYIDF